MLIAALLLSRGVAAEPGELVVIVHPSNAAHVLSADELRPLFLTREQRWPNGDKAKPVNLPRESDERRAFDSAALGMSQEEVERYWVDRKIRGGAPPPVTLSSVDAVVAFVGSTKGAVGYVASSHASDKVRIVARLRGGAVVSP